MKPYKASQWTREMELDDNNVPTLEDEEGEYEELETERLLQWRRVKRNRKWTRDFLVLLKNRSLSDATWVQEEDFIDKAELEFELERGKPVEVK